MSAQPQASSRKIKHKPTHEKLGLSNPEDILLWVPRRYNDFTRQFNGELEEPGLVFQGVMGREIFSEGGGKFSVLIENQTHAFKATFFGNPKFSEVGKLSKGDPIAVRGLCKQFGHQLYINNVEYIPPEQVGAVIPVYPALRGRCSADEIFKAVRQLFKDSPGCVNTVRQRILDQFGPTYTEKEIVAFTGLTYLNIANTLRALHFPSNYREAENASLTVRRLAGAFVQIRADQLHQKLPFDESVIAIDDQWVKGHIAQLPYPLTQSQLTSVAEIITDLRSPYPMRRLLSGDVGFGKTLTYTIPVAAAHLKGASCGVLIQNSLLVSQVVKSLKDGFPGVSVIQVRSAKDLPKKSELDSEKPILVGTTGMTNAIKKIGYSLDFLVIDEQQKLSVEQKEQLCDPHTNVLEATATCVPRTTALVEYGGMDRSVLRDCPVPKDIRTGIVTPSSQGFDKRAMFEYLKAQIAKGHRVAMIYPRVENNGEQEKLSIEHAANSWQNNFGIPAAVVHGRLKAEEKEYQMNLFRSGNVKLLISSTVVEIGVDIEDLRVIVIVSAGQYGVSTLHQMRGRVARNGGTGICIFYCPEEPEPETLERLQIVASTNDGFKLADLDAELRGFGNLSENESQSGKTATLFPNLKLMPSDIVLGKNSTT